MPEKLGPAYTGGLTVVGRTSPSSLYDTAHATYDEGFIEIWAMPTVVANARRCEHSTRPTQHGLAPKATTQARKSK
ncbi:MAG TPA: hypothetical protein VEI80_07290 [Candidatus Acidoferrales bacterium]|nr:hypothetical protein [Candidatus Acidoferrales bacterium]